MPLFGEYYVDSGFLHRFQVYIIIVAIKKIFVIKRCLILKFLLIWVGINLKNNYKIRKKRMLRQ